MLNIEKYKDEMLNAIENGDDLIDAICTFYYNDNDYCNGDRGLLNWLCKEYKEPILDEEEKAYLSAVIKPFRNRVDWIEKVRSINTTECINITYDDTEYEIPFPQFEKGTMYKGMELNREYTLEELGL